jgi:hypothetical protein
MITNFEEFTYDLTKEELDTVVPWLETELSFAIEKENILSNWKLVENCPFHTTPSRIRMIIHALRTSGKIPFLLANNKGYYRSNKRAEITDYIASLRERANSINQVANSLVQQLKQYDESSYQQKLLF